MLKPSEWLDILVNKLRAYPGEKVHIHLFGTPPDAEMLDGLKDLFEGLGAGLRVLNHAGKTKLEESVRLLSG